MHPRRFLSFVVTLLFALGGCAPTTNATDDGGSGQDAGEGSGDDDAHLEASITGSPNAHTTLLVETFPEAFSKWRDTPDGERLSVHANADPGVSDQYGVGSQSLRIYFIYDDERTYTFGEVDGAGGAYAEIDRTHEFFAQYGNELGSGSITISERTDDRLVGTFSLNGAQQNGAATVTLEGEFDLPLVPDGG